MKKFIFSLIFLCLPLFLFGQEMVEKIEIVGNERVTRDTILYYLSSREGEYFNDSLIKKDFRVLWETGFFSDIRIEQAQGNQGKIVRITVVENPVIRNIVYKTGKKVKEDDIVNKLKETDEYVLPYSYYSPYRIQRIKRTIEDLLLEKGLQSGQVKVKTEKQGKNEVEVIFDIDEGPKIRVGQVILEGKSKIPPSVVKEAMKQNRKHDLISWITGKDVYKQNKLEEDLANIKKKFQEYGFMEASIGEPRVEEITKKTIFLKKQKMMKIIIPVNAGYRYRVGEVKIEGNTALSTKFLSTLIKYKKGDLYSTKNREKSIEDIGEVYRDGGYLRAQVFPVESLDPKRKLVNVTFNIYEGEVAYLHRLEFRGNNYTKDKVIRREFLLREGDRFSLAYFKNSLLRIKQLGLVELEQEPDIRPSADDPNQMDVLLNVKELQRNNIQFTAGYSGYEGTFIALSYSTVNFLGAGENLEFMVQQGKRVKNYMFGFTEPYFLDYPVTLGFNIYDRKIILPGLYNRRGKGADFMVGGRIKGYWRTNLTYRYELVDIELPSEDEESPFFYNPFYYGTYFGAGNYKTSSIIPTIYRSTIDSPLTPSKGTMYLASCKFSGGILGGEIDLIKPRLEFTRFQPLWSGHVFGFHVEYQYVKPRPGSDLPFWERFYLGGERSIRGYDIYSIGPRDENFRNLGGDKSLVFNVEYIIPVGGPLYAIFFYDGGNAYGPEQKVSLRNLYTSAGLEMRIFVPALRIPFRLIFAYNNPKIYAEDSNFQFRFAVGTTF
ncbi:MAG: outer membrane protein assembly factor BamA [Candidatus Aminicenantes bacterium]|nr:outer membrane protein assembly factor BamA [Candidatus Aminicenantes bacterium]